MIEELRDQVKFLRSALEARDRDAAELRAALRDALKMSARALTEGSDKSDRQVLAPELNGEPETAQIRAQNIEVDKVAEQSQSGRNSGRKTFRKWLLEVLQK